MYRLVRRLDGAVLQICEGDFQEFLREKYGGYFAVNMVEYKLKTLKGEDAGMEELKKRITELENKLERVKAPEWFVKEFGSADLGGVIYEPQFTQEGWRTIAVVLRVVRSEQNYFS